MWRVILNITVYTLSLWLCLSASKGIGTAIRNEETMNFYDSTSFPLPRIFPLSLDTVAFNRISLKLLWWKSFFPEQICKCVIIIIKTYCDSFRPAGWLVQ